MRREPPLLPSDAKPSRLLATILGAINLLAYFAVVLVLLNLDLDSWNVVLAAMLFMVTSPFILLVGGWMGVRLARPGHRRSAWGFARPGNVILTVVTLLLAVAFGEILRARDCFAVPSDRRAWQTRADIAELKNALRAPQASRRLEAADELAVRYHGQAAELILPLLHDQSPEVRRSVIVDLSRLRALTAVESVISMLKDPSSQVRLAAVVALGEIRDERATGPLIRLLADRALGANAAEALANIGGVIAIEPLIDALALMSSQERHADADRTAAALRRLTGEDIEPNATRWREWRRASANR